MTERQIIRKLREALSEDIAKERDVMYILVESRKLLEDSEPGEPYFALKLYCHWAVHVDLAGRDTTLPFLQKVDAYVESVLADNNFVEQEKLFREFGLLQSFRQLFKRFLDSYGLPTRVCDDDALWQRFLTMYAGVIEDGSLSCNAQPGDLRLVSGVTFSKGVPVEECYLPFNIVWDIRLLDGRTLEVSSRAFRGPQGDEMVFRRLHLH